MTRLLRVWYRILAWLGLVPLLLGCAPSLEAARAEGIAARKGLPLSAVGVAPSQRCQLLDDRQVALSGWAKVAAGLGGGALASLLLAEVRDSQPGRIAVIGGSAGMTAAGIGLEVSAAGTRVTWNRECLNP